MSINCTIEHKFSKMNTTNKYLMKLDLEKKTV